MAMTDEEADGPAIRALGSLFKLSQVFLWDESSMNGRRGSSFPKHIRFKYEDDDNEEGDGHGKVVSTTSPVATGVIGDVSPDDMDIIRQMSSLGFPLSFYTNKERNGTAKGKKKIAQQSSRQNVEKDNLGVEFSSMPLADEVDVSDSSAKMDSLRHVLSSSEGNDPDDMAPLYNSSTLKLHGFDGLSDDMPGNNDSVVDDFGSDIASEQPQFSDVADCLSDAAVFDGDGTYGCVGSMGDWSVFWDSHYMRNYFYNVKTQESTWYAPLGMENFAVCDVSGESHESSTNMAITDVNPAVFSNESELIDSCAMTNRSLEGESSMNGFCQLELACDRSSSTVKLSSDCSLIENESPVLEGDCLDMILPSFSLDIEGQILDLGSDMKLIGSDEVFEDKISHLNVESMEGIRYEVSREDLAGVTKGTKKTRRKRSRKNSSGNDQEHLFQCSVEAYCGGIGKYWWQRYQLFSKFDEGIQMDEEGWFSVTPELIARHQASRCGGSVIIDCFAGVGGNAIQFAKLGKNVIAIDIDPNKIEYVHHNAAIYGVRDQIDLIIGDSFCLAPALRADAVFISPPWGGPDYKKVKAYDLTMLKPRDGQSLFSTFKGVSSMIVMFLPRNVVLNQLAELCLSVDPPWSVEVEKNFLNGRLKAITAYFWQTSV